jgi:hypothetical protein
MAAPFEQLDTEPTIAEDLRDSLAVLRTKPALIRWFYSGLKTIPDEQEWATGHVQQLINLPLPYQPKKVMSGW